VIEPPDFRSLDSAAKDALIVALTERVNVLTGFAQERPPAQKVWRLHKTPGYPAVTSGSPAGLPH